VPATDLSGDPLRLMAVHAHPDDESSKGAAATARYVAEGVAVMVVTCTGGERGDVLNPALAHDPAVLADLPAIRQAEMDRAREILGVEQRWLGFVDSGWVEDYVHDDAASSALPEGCFARMDVAVAAEPLAALIREFRPQVVTTYDESGGYPHPDHIMCHLVTMAALDLAADPGLAPQLGAPWAAQKVYYHRGFNKPRFEALHQATLAAGVESPFQEWLDEWVDRPEDEDVVTARVPCAEYFGVRDDALRAHATQIDAEGWWFQVPLEIQTAAWPTEDFQLARSSVPVDGQEDDLFAGLRAPRDDAAGG
jgi:mycothiol S-conjugate amidase